MELFLDRQARRRRPVQPGDTIVSAVAQAQRDCLRDLQARLVGIRLSVEESAQLIREERLLLRGYRPGTPLLLSGIPCSVQAVQARPPSTLHPLVQLDEQLKALEE